MDTKGGRFDPSSLPITEPSGITVDEEGNWFYRGNPIIREDILKLFYDHIRFIPDLGYVIEWQKALHPITVVDTPFVITRIDAERDGRNINTVWLTLKHIPEQEPLNPSTLFIGQHNILYCRIQNGAFIARFLRPAYYQLAELVEEEKGKFFIEVGGEKYFIGTDQNQA